AGPRWPARAGRGPAGPGRAGELAAALMRGGRQGAALLRLGMLRRAGQGRGPSRGVRPSHRRRRTKPTRRPRPDRRPRPHTPPALVRLAAHPQGPRPGELLPPTRRPVTCSPSALDKVTPVSYTSLTRSAAVVQVAAWAAKAAVV